MMMERVTMIRNGVDRYYGNINLPRVDVRVNLMGMGISVEISVVSDFGGPNGSLLYWDEEMDGRRVSVSCRLNPYKRIDVLV